MEKKGGFLYKVEDKDVELLKKDPKKFWKDVDVIGSQAFYCLSGLTDITVPEGVIRIDHGAFLECKHLASVSLPSTVTEIGRQAFRECESLKSITLPDGVTSLAQSLFHDCISLSEVTLPSKLESIEFSAFANCKNLKSVALPKTVNSIGVMAFNNCKNLTEINLPENIKIIDTSAFNGCESLKSITLPQNISAINRNTFMGCSSLESITIPSSLQRIETGAFSGCKSLESIAISDHTMQLVDFDVFNGCKFDYLYRPKDSHQNIFSRTLPEGEMEIVIYFEKFAKAFVDFDYMFLVHDNPKIYEKLADRLNKCKVSLPFPFVTHMYLPGKLEQFSESADFRFLRSEPSVDLTLNENYASLPWEEVNDYYKFMLALGCFSPEKIKDNRGKDTEVPYAQKATSVFAKMLKSGRLKVGDFHRRFTSLGYNLKPNQEFLKFISQPAEKGKLSNFEMLLELDELHSDCFVKVMENFEVAKSYRTMINENGVPVTLPWREAIEKFYFSERYTGVTPENKDIADVFVTKSISQKVFDQAVKLREQAKEQGVGEHILGKPLKEPSILESIEQVKADTSLALQNAQEIISDLYSKKFTYEMLSKRDPRNAIMGAYASCCGTIASTVYGHDIAVATVLAKNVQNLVIRDDKGNIVAKGSLYVNTESGYGVFNDFEINEAYRGSEAGEYGDYGGIYRIQTNNQKYLQEQRDLIFDSIMRGIKAFVEEYNAIHPDNPITQINVGMGYNRLKEQCQRYRQATQNLTVPSEYGFRDAEDEQRVLYKNYRKELGGLEL